MTNPSWQSLHNKWLIVQDHVRLTSQIDPVIADLDRFFAEENLRAFVTSGLRTVRDQLVIIQKYIVRKGLDSKYPESVFCKDVHVRFEWEGKQVYQWQPGWSALLNVGVIINPPLPAECLLDYINKDGNNRKGAIIGQSPHFTGGAFDIGGGSDGINNELEVIKKALATGIKGIKGYLPEHNNNAVHIDVKKEA